MWRFPRVSVNRVLSETFYNAGRDTAHSDFPHMACNAHYFRYGENMHCQPKSLPRITSVGVILSSILSDCIICLIYVPVNMPIWIFRRLENIERTYRNASAVWSKFWQTTSQSKTLCEMRGARSCLLEQEFPAWYFLCLMQFGWHCSPLTRKA